jgi:serine protease Do
MVIHNISKLLIFVVVTLGVMGVAGAVPMPGDAHSGAYMGIMVDNVSPEQAAALHLKDGNGAAITGVDQDGPACRAGLKTGDVVVTFNGTRIEDADQLASLIHSSAAGKTVAMTVVRDGKSQEVKVTLGDWREMAHMPKVPLPPVVATPFAAPTPPLPGRMYPDVDIQSVTTLSARHGIVVEPLSPQLCDFFGVPQNKGVLVRSVEKGSPGAAAGLRAGDVVLKVNSETVHDMADWRRALKSNNGKLTFSIVRDKKVQTIEMALPANSSKLQNQDWNGISEDMRALAGEMQQLGPELAEKAGETATLAQLDQHQIDEINRQADVAAKNAIPDLNKQAEKVRKQADAAMKAATPEMKKQAEKLSKQAAEIAKQSEQVRKQMEKMAPQLERDAILLADSVKPSAKEIADMARQMEETIKVMGPEFQKQMEQFKKDMEKEKRDWQDILKGTDTKHF